jgi:hypothetical protein
MRIARNEALSMLRSWGDDDVLIRCELRFRALAAVLWSRVVSVSDTEARFLDADRGELVLLLRADLTFLYGDTRSFPHLARKKYRRGFVVLLPSKDDPAHADTIVFAEFAKQ